MRAGGGRIEGRNPLSLKGAAVKAKGKEREKKKGVEGPTTPGRASSCLQVVLSEKLQKKKKTGAIQQSFNQKSLLTCD